MNERPIEMMRYLTGHTVEIALEVMEQGVRFLRAVRKDYEAGRI